MVGAQDKIVITGAAGLVGHNLSALLCERGHRNLVGIDKHPHNADVLVRLQPDMEVVQADLARPGDWSAAFAGARAAVLLHAQIGGKIERDFEANNLTATRHVIDACKTHRVPYLVHVSSSVVNSAARDHYTETKKAQERVVLDSGIPSMVLRPTLMFGWFDRKHLGWLARFMQRVPVFPIPGSGRYLRQPLYIRDFCGIIAACLASGRSGETHNISGMQAIDYIDIIREIKTATGARARIVRIPYGLFWSFLRLWSLFDPDPPFTTAQLRALATPDRFEVIPWDELFGVSATPFAAAVRQTFTDPRYSQIKLEF